MKYFNYTSLSARSQVLDRSKGKCEECGTKSELHVHHLNYIRFGHENINDLIALCLNCHGLKHPNRTFKPMWLQKQISAKRKTKRIQNKLYPSWDQKIKAAQKAVDKAPRKNSMEYVLSEKFMEADNQLYEWKKLFSKKTKRGIREGWGWVAKK